MNLINIQYNEENKAINRNKNIIFIKIEALITNYYLLILVITNIIFNIYLSAENKKKTQMIKEILDFKNTFDYKNKNFKNYYPNNDKEFIGLYYPEINFEQIKTRLKHFNIIASLVDLLGQLENKLIYLEKEINITKLTSFYTSRKYFLDKRNITYDETNLKNLHEIINWIIIHKSDQLKGIASDKYLACKYVEMKLGKNLCGQRIKVYNKFEELNYKELFKYGNIILKISNSCWDKIFINNNTKRDVFETKIKHFKKLFQSEHGLIESQFFHLYSKKRIIIERQFFPVTDLYEFKFFIINNRIKFIYLLCYLNKQIKILIYDEHFNFLFKEKRIKEAPLNITFIFTNNILKKLKKFAFKLSEDFPNFIRVDLYVFHNKIYFSELLLL